MWEREPGGSGCSLAWSFGNVFQDVPWAHTKVLAEPIEGVELDPLRAPLIELVSGPICDAGRACERLHIFPTFSHEPRNPIDYQ